VIKNKGILVSTNQVVLCYRSRTVTFSLMSL